MSLTSLRTSGRDLADVVMARWGRPTFALAIPRRGAVVAEQLAHRLRVPMDLVLATTVSVAGRPVAGVAVPDLRVVDHVAIAAASVAESEVEAACEQALAALADRIPTLRGDVPLPDLADGHVVVVDDAAITGLTAAAAIAALRARGVGRVTLAIALATPAAIDRLSKVADHVIALRTMPAAEALARHESASAAICPPIGDEEIRAWMLATQRDAGIDPYGDLETDGLPAHPAP